MGRLLDQFNQQMSAQAFAMEARALGIDPELHTRLREREMQTVDIEKELAPKPTPSFTRGFIGEAGKTASGLFDQMFRNIRATSQLAATPIAGVLALPRGGATPSQAMIESLRLAKETAIDKTKSVDFVVEDAAQKYLQSRGIGKYGTNEANIGDVAALATLGFANLFGDPAFEFGIGLKGVRALKEFATFKKVGKVTKELPEEVAFVKGTTRTVEIPLTPDLKIKIQPKTSEVILTGYKRRFPTQSAIQEGKLAPETTDLLMNVREATGAEMIAKFKGDDLILRPKEPIKKAEEAISAIPKEFQPLAQEARKYKSAEEFVKKGILEKEFPLEGLGNTPMRGIALHGTNFPKKILEEGFRPSEGTFGKGIYLDPLGDRAVQTFGGKSGRNIVGVEYNFKNPYIIRNVGEKVPPLEILKKQGYDGVVFLNRTGMGRGIDEIIAFDKSSLKTSQLTDFYNQAVKEIKVEPIEVPRAQLPVGEGIERVSRLEERINERLKALPKEEQVRIPTYQQMSKKEQIIQATKFVQENPEKTMEILKGEAPAPKGLLYNSLFLAMDESAKGNAPLAARLASLRSTRFGQEISILTELDKHSPVRYMTNLSNAKVEAIGGREELQRIKNVELEKVKKSVKTANLKDSDWNEFIKSIVCT